MGDLQDHILDAMRSEGRSLADVERAADVAGVPHGQKANTRQRAAILARLYGWSIEQPDAGLGTPASGEGGGERSSDLPAAADSASAGGESPPPPAAPSPEALMDSILAVTNGALVPPKPGTPEYKALPSGTERSQAKAYWDREKQDEPEPETLAEQLRVEA